MQMVSDIRAAVGASDGPEALIVTIPSEDVKVAEAVAAGLLVFGLYSGYEHYDELWMPSFVAADQREAGATAANKFLEINSGERRMPRTSVGVTETSTPSGSRD